MKIVHIIIGLNVGGAELMLKRLVLHSKQNNTNQHSIISLTDIGIIGTDLKNNGIPIYTLDMKSVVSITKTFMKLRKLLKKIEPDVVQTWMYHSDFLGGLAAKSVGVKNIIWGIRTTDVSQGGSKITVHLSMLCAKISYYIPNFIVCAAQTSKDYHIKLGYDKTKMVVINNGFDLNSISATQEEGSEIRIQNGLSPQDIVIGSIGRFNTVKNQKLFVDTASRLVSKNSNLKFMMIGKDNTIENHELMTWINHYNLIDNFMLLGQRDDIPKLLKAMDIFCLHSKTEGFPNVLVEAMANGVSCISTDVGDAKHIISEYGSLVPEGDSEKMSEGISKILNNKKASEEAYSDSIEYIHNNFSIEKAYNSFSKLWMYCENDGSC